MCNHVLPDGQRCDGLLSTDGRSYGILRHSPALAYAHELMYQWSSRMANRGIAWYTMWRDIVDDIKGCGNVAFMFGGMPSHIACQLYVAFKEPSGFHTCTSELESASVLPAGSAWRRRGSS